MAKIVSRLISYGASLKRLSTSTLTAAAETTVTKTKPPKKTTLQHGEKSLYRRLNVLGGSDANLYDILNEWVKEGKNVPKAEVIRIASLFRSYKKYNQASQVMEWLENSDISLSPSDRAIRLDLLAKKDGIETAEKYFEGLPESERNKLTYGALLNCYCKEKMKEKALSLFEEMRDLNFTYTSLAYNNLMSLYMKVGEPEKVLPLVQEMKKKDIKPDSHTHTFLMNSYALMNDIEGVEKVMEEIKKDGFNCDWGTYGTLASIYAKAGLIDKANKVLEEVENKMIKTFRGRSDYHIVIGLYALTSNKSGVYRVWGSLKYAYPTTTNMSYVSLLHALHRLGDTEGLEKHFKEWEKNCLAYDIKVANYLIESYLSRDMIDEAQLLCETATKRGARPNPRTVEAFISFYLKKNQMVSALKYFNDAASKANENKWKPSEEIISTLRKYFEEEKDIENAELFLKSLKKVQSLGSEDYDSLLRTYIAAGRTEPEIRERMKADGVDPSSETEGLLERVCSE